MMYFPALFSPKANKNNPAAAPQYAAVLLLDSAAVQTQAYQAMRQAVASAISEKFGAAKAADPAFVRKLALPFRDASEKAGESGYPGFEDGDTFFRAWRKEDFDAPGVIDLHGEDIVVPGDVWSGQLARFTVRAFAWENTGKRGVSFGLDHVQIVKKDMPKLGSASASAAFKGAEAADGQDLSGYGVTGALGSSDGGSTPAADLPF